MNWSLKTRDIPLYWSYFLSTTWNVAWVVHSALWYDWLRLFYQTRWLSDKLRAIVRDIGTRSITGNKYDFFVRWVKEQHRSWILWTFRKNIKRINISHICLYNYYKKCQTLRRATTQTSLAVSSQCLLAGLLFRRCMSDFRAYWSGRHGPMQMYHSFIKFATRALTI